MQQHSWRSATWLRLLVQACHPSLGHTGSQNSIFSKDTNGCRLALCLHLPGEVLSVRTKMQLLFFSLPRGTSSIAWAAPRNTDGLQKGGPFFLVLCHLKKFLSNILLHGCPVEVMVVSNGRCELKNNIIPLHSSSSPQKGPSQHLWL